MYFSNYFIHNDMIFTSLLVTVTIRFAACSVCSAAGGWQGRVCLSLGIPGAKRSGSFNILKLFIPVRISNKNKFDLYHNCFVTL